MIEIEKLTIQRGKREKPQPVTKPVTRIEDFWLLVPALFWFIAFAVWRLSV